MPTLQCFNSLTTHTYTQPHVASSEVVTTWTEAGRCPYVTDIKTIVHPGEVRVLAGVCGGGLKAREVCVRGLVSQEVSASHPSKCRWLLLRFAHQALQSSLLLRPSNRPTHCIVSLTPPPTHNNNNTRHSTTHICVAPTGEQDS